LENRKEREMEFSKEISEAGNKPGPRPSNFQIRGNLRIPNEMARYGFKRDWKDPYRKKRPSNPPGS